MKKESQKPQAGSGPKPALSTPTPLEKEIMAQIEKQKNEYLGHQFGGTRIINCGCYYCQTGKDPNATLKAALKAAAATERDNNKSKGETKTWQK